MTNNLKFGLALAFLLFASLSLPASAQYIISDTTINTNVGGVAIGLDASGATYSPIVDIVPGGQLGFSSVYGGSVVNNIGGLVGQVFAYDQSVINLYTGVADFIVISNDAQLNVYGDYSFAGDAYANLYASENGVINFFGTDLSIDNPQVASDYTMYDLHGALFNGVSLEGGTVFLKDNARVAFNIVPESSGMIPGAVFGIFATIGLGWRRQKRER